MLLLLLSLIGTAWTTYACLGHGHECSKKHKEHCCEDSHCHKIKHKEYGLCILNTAGDSADLTSDFGMMDMVDFDDDDVPPVVPMAIMSRNNCRIEGRVPDGFWLSVGIPGRGRSLSVEQYVYSTSGNERHSPGFLAGLVGLFKGGFAFGSHAHPTWAYYSSDQTVLDAFEKGVNSGVTRWKNHNTLAPISAGPAPDSGTEYWQWTWTIHNSCGRLRYHSKLITSIPSNKVKHPCCAPGGFKNPGGKEQVCSSKEFVITAYKECVQANKATYPDLPDMSESDDMESFDLEVPQSGFTPDALGSRHNCKIVTAPTAYWDLIGTPGRGRSQVIEQKVVSSSGNEKKSPGFASRIIGIMRSFKFGSKSHSGRDTYTGSTDFGTGVLTAVTRYFNGNTLQPIVTHSAGSSDTEFWQWVWVIHDTCGTLKYKSKLYTAIPSNSVKHPCCLPGHFVTEGGMKCTDRNAVITPYTECLGPNSLSANMVPPESDDPLAGSEILVDYLAEGNSADQMKVTDEMGVQQPDYGQRYRDDDSLPHNVDNDDDDDSLSVAINLVMNVSRNVASVVKNNSMIFIFVGLVAGMVAIVAIASKVRKAAIEDAAETDSLLSVAA